MKFEWDENKNQINIQKHGLDFVDAAKVFEQPHLSFEDNRFDYGEKRFIGAGLLKNRLVIIVYSKRGDKLRIISMRKANEREQKKFRHGLEAAR